MAATFTLAGLASAGMTLGSKGPDFNITRVGDREVRLERNAKATALV